MLPVIISLRYFRQFCRAFGLREIIVCLIILICYSATLCACPICFTSASDGIYIFNSNSLQRYNFFLRYANVIVFISILFYYRTFRRYRIIYLNKYELPNNLLLFFQFCLYNMAITIRLSPLFPISHLVFHHDLKFLFHTCVLQ